MAVVPDKARKDLIELRPEGGGRAAKYFFKLEKAELYLTPAQPGDADPKPDFSGAASPVLILQREKK